MRSIVKKQVKKIKMSNRWKLIWVFMIFNFFLIIILIFKNVDWKLKFVIDFAIIALAWNNVKSAWVKSPTISAGIERK